MQWRIIVIRRLIPLITYFAVQEENYMQINLSPCLMNLQLIWKMYVYKLIRTQQEGNAWVRNITELWCLHFIHRAALQINIRL